MARKIQMKTEIVDVDEIHEIIVAFANGDFSRRLYLSESLNERDIIISGINMLGEELEKKTVSRNYFSGIFNSIPEILVVIDKKGFIQNINQNGLKIIANESSENLIGKNIKELFSEDINQRFETFSKQKVYSISFESEMKNKKQNSFPAFCSLSRINDSGSKQFLFIAQDISEKKKEELRILKATINGQEIERRRLANDLHDSLGQELNAVKMYINAIEKMNSESDLFKRSIKDVHGLLNLTIESIRDISFGLMPSVLSRESLNTSILQLINRVNALKTIPVYYSIPERPLIFDDKNDELFIYRIVQEFLNNSIKHSSAEKIWLEFKINESKNRIEILLKDNGVGFNFEDIQNKNGLNNITYRLQALGAEYKYNSVVGKGTELKIIIKQ